MDQPTRKCSMCGGIKTLESFSICKKVYRSNVCKVCIRKRSWNRIKSNPELLEIKHKKKNEWSAFQRKKDFEEAIDHYGGKCVICGDSRKIALLLHHPNGGGSKKSRKDFYRKLRINEYNEELVVMCGSCHLILHRENGFRYNMED